MLAAVIWIVATLTGSVGTAIAVIAIAWLGILLFFGRVPYERGVRVVLGCFIIFGAGQIAAALIGLSGGERGYTEPQALDVPAYVESVPDPSLTDPYAGAAMPPAKGEVGLSLD